MVLEFKGIREVEQLIRFPYYMNLHSYGVDTDRYHATIKELSIWSKKVEIHMYYCSGSIYFKNEKDLLAFQLRWC